ncbi:OmpH family outer membrane protein [Alphaproteobacteria bacterium]|nr:OmpH family outer membrane protein [Alphaproteobacteria bacterium]
MKFPNIKIVALLICSFVLSTGPAVAQIKLPSGSIKFAVVNFQKIFRDAAATRSIAPQIVKLKKSFEVQFKDLKKELQSAEQDLQSQRSILSPEAYAQKQKMFKKQVNGVQRNVQMVQRMVGRAEGKAYKTVRQTFHLITKEVAKEWALQLIFPRSGLIHADPRYDISDEVLKRLNKRLPSVTVRLPAAREGGPKASTPKKK